MLKFILAVSIGLFGSSGFIMIHQNPEKRAVTKIKSVIKRTPLQISIKRGLIVYKKECLSCHQEDGSGVPRMAPSLTGARKLRGRKSELIELVLNGPAGKADTGDEIFQIPMASFNYLTDRQIADVLTFIRNSFGNKTVAVNAAEVKVVRAKIN